MSSSSTLSSNFLIQFRTFCCNVEQDSQKLRKLMEKPALGAGSSSIIGVEEENYVNSLKNQVIGLNDQFERIESQLCGPIETRLSQVSVGEVSDKKKKGILEMRLGHNSLLQSNLFSLTPLITYFYFHYLDFG